MPCMHMQCPPLSLYLYCTFPQYMNILLGYKVYLQELEWDWRGHFIWMVSSYCISHLTFVHFLTEYNLKKKLEWEPEMSLWFNIHLQSLYAFRSNLCHAVMHCWSSKTGEGKLSLPSPLLSPPPPPIIPFLPVYLPHIHFYIRNQWVAQAAFGCANYTSVPSFLLSTDVAFSLSEMPPCVINWGCLKYWITAFRQSSYVLLSLSCGIWLSVRPNLHH